MSDVARRIQQIDLEREAMQNALFGLAYGMPRHDFIEARATRGAIHILQLIEEDKCDEAMTLMDAPDWGEGTEKEVEGSSVLGDNLHTKGR